MVMLLFAVLGAIFGSFLNVVIYRLPIMLEHSWQKALLEYLQPKTPSEILQKYFNISETYNINLALPNSHCPNCKTPLAVWQNIPILSFILLRGKCFYCKARISWQYPLVELLASFFMLVLAYKFFYNNIYLFIFLTIFVFALLVISFIDLQHLIIPDAISLFLIWQALIFHFYFNYPEFSQFFYGAIFGYLSFWLLSKTMQILLKKPALGQGDVKLFAALGATLGWQCLIPLAFIAACLGLLAFAILVILNFKTIKSVKLDMQIPFGPFLSASALIFIIYPQPVLSLLSVWFYTTDWYNFLLVF